MFKTRTALFYQLFCQKLEKFESELEAQEFLELTKHVVWVFKNSPLHYFLLHKELYLDMDCYGVLLSSNKWKYSKKLKVLVRN